MVTKFQNHMLDIIERNINTREWALSTFWIKSTFTGLGGRLEYVQRYLMEKISSVWLYVDSHTTEWKIIAFLASNVQFKGTASNMKLFLEAILGLAIVQSKYYPPLHSGLHIQGVSSIGTHFRFQFLNFLMVLWKKLTLQF